MRLGQLQIPKNISCEFARKIVCQALVTPKNSLTVASSDTYHQQKVGMVVMSDPVK
jgi:hypothetical protein